jgi:hypothetical protein
MDKSKQGFAYTIREMKKGQMVAFPVKNYSTVCSTVTRFNTEYKAEGRRYRAKVQDLSVIVTRLA